MGELQDYRGEYNPDLKIQDFSKDVLVRFWEEAGKMYVGLGGLWHSVVSERFGEEVGRELNLKVWERAILLEVRRVCKALNISGNDVATMFKIWQFDPAGPAVTPMRGELKNKNHGILYVSSCKALEYCERTGDVGLIKHQCDKLERLIFEVTASHLNPKMKVTSLKLPPRKSPDETPVCIWELKIEED